MRTTLDIPEPLIEEARKLLGFKSKTDTVILSLRELIRRKRIEQLKSLMGAVRLDIDVPQVTAAPKTTIMIFVDTSVWVRALRRADLAESEHLTTLLDMDEVALAIPVRIEILMGASRRDRALLKSTLAALPVFESTSATWRRMEDWVETASNAGERFGVADMLIGAIAAEHGGPIWSRDSDFERMAKLGLLDVYRPS